MSHAHKDAYEAGLRLTRDEALEAVARMSGFSSVEEWRSYQKSLRPVSHTRRLLRRLDDFNADHTYITAGLVGAVLGLVQFFVVERHW